jgi:hypothetical protein
VNLKFSFILFGAAASAFAAGPARAGVLLTEPAALARAFPTPPRRKTLYLTEEQVAAVEKLAHSRLPSPVVTVFLGRAPDGSAQHAVLDTHVVRTMPETVLTVVSADGSLRMALVLQFGEPPDYLPRPGWLDTLQHRALDDELWPGRGVRRVTGATLTVQSLTEAVRRGLAVDALLLRRTP